MFLARRGTSNVIDQVDRRDGLVSLLTIMSLFRGSFQRFKYWDSVNKGGGKLDREFSKDLAIRASGTRFKSTSLAGLRTCLVTFLLPGSTRVSDKIGIPLDRFGDPSSIFISDLDGILQCPHWAGLRLLLSGSVRFGGNIRHDRLSP